jgi:hypothetical protein
MPAHLNVEVRWQEASRAILGQTPLVFPVAREFAEHMPHLIKSRLKIAAIGMPLEMRRERALLEFQGDLRALFSKVRAQLLKQIGIFRIGIQALS